MFEYGEVNNQGEDPRWEAFDDLLALIRNPQVPCICADNLPF